MLIPFPHFPPKHRSRHAAPKIIRRKRDGKELSAGRLRGARGIHDGGLSEGQVAAFAMAVFFRGMTTARRVAMTRALPLGRAARLAGSRPAGADRRQAFERRRRRQVSLMLAPITAACGAFVPMISGRGLGRTGGTLDAVVDLRIRHPARRPSAGSFARSVAP